MAGIYCFLYIFSEFFGNGVELQFATVKIILVQLRKWQMFKSKIRNNFCER